MLRPGIYDDKDLQAKAVKTGVKSLGLVAWRTTVNDKSVNLLPHLLHAKNKVYQVQMLTQFATGSNSIANTAMFQPYREGAPETRTVATDTA